MGEWREEFGEDLAKRRFGGGLIRGVWGGWTVIWKC